MTAVHELSPLEASAICNDLQAADDSIDVVVRIVDHIVHVYPLEEVTTEQEVTVLAAFLGATDARVMWHQVGAA